MNISVFDASGLMKVAVIQNFAYTLRGMPPVDCRLLTRGKRYSAITAVTVNGVQDVVPIEGSVNGE